MHCKCCGKCCLASFTAYITEDDLFRWRREERKDILDVIGHERLVWVGDHMISADDGHYAGECPFLAPSSSGTWLCSIYETRPRVCRDYRPGSSELCPQWHGEDTGHSR